MHATYIRPRDLPQLQNSAASQKRHSLQNVADTALKATAGFWFLVAAIGQWAFLYYIVAFYGPSTLQGNFEAWSKNTFLLIAEASSRLKARIAGVLYLIIIVAGAFAEAFVDCVAVPETTLTVPSSRAK